MNPYTVYLFQDHQSDLAARIVEIGYGVQVYATTSDFLNALSKQPQRSCAVLNLKESLDDGSLIQQKALTDRISIPFVYVIDHANTNFAVSVVRRGAVSVLERPINVDELTTSLEVAFLSSDSYRAFAESGSYYARLATLSEREHRIVQLAADGMPNKRIANILGLSVKTVEKQRRQAYQRLCVSSTAEMTRAVTLGNLHPLISNVSSVEH